MSARRRRLAVIAAFVVVVVAFVSQADDDGGRQQAGTRAANDGDDGAAQPTRVKGATQDQGPTTTTPAYDGWVDPASAGKPWGAKVEGLLTFRGNPTRSWYGEGPVPRDPEVVWSYPGESGGMCGESSVDGEVRTWCGTGWTGQPAVWERDGRTTVAFGAYDKAVHVLDAESGDDVLQPFATGDIIKGSVTVDPDGYPLLYSGSRDGYYRVLALDRGDTPVELWKLSADAVSPTKWNDDWDGAGLVLDDFLVEGGENSQLHIVRLNRAYDDAGKVTVKPELVFNAPGWDDELLAAIGDDEVSIENSVAVSGNTVFFANSGGLVQGWDLSGLQDGQDPTRTFRYWTGDDTDASIVVDAEGMLYVASEYERGTDRSAEVGQLLKLDPSKPDDPLVWSVPDDEVRPGGLWSTPAIHEGMVYVGTDGGRLLAVDQESGELAWEKQLAGPTWPSPVVVDDVLIEGDCDGVLHAYDVSEPGVEPDELWAVELDGCIESTPAVWRGQVFVGTRGGRFYALGD